MEGGQSDTYLRQTRASSGPRVSITKTYSDETKRKLIFRPDHSGLPQQYLIPHPGRPSMSLCDQKKVCM